MAIPLGVLVVAGLMWLLRRRRGGGGGDGAARIAAAVDRLPAGRRDWGGRWPPSWARCTGAPAAGGSWPVLRVVLFP
jgi:hypothetical protein